MEYSYDKLSFIENFTNILYDLIVKIIHVSNILKIKSAYDKKDNLDALSYVIEKLKDPYKNSYIIDLILNNIRKINEYLKNYITITQKNVIDEDIMAFVYTLSFFIHEEIDYEHIIKPIEDIIGWNMNIKDIKILNQLKNYIVSD